MPELFSSADWPGTLRLYPNDINCVQSGILWLPILGLWPTPAVAGCNLHCGQREPSAACNHSGVAAEALRLWLVMAPGCVRFAEEVQEHEHFRTCRRVLKASIGRPEFAFPVVVGSVVGGLASESIGLSRRATPGAAARRPGSGADRAGSALHATDSRTVAAIGGADCAVSRFAGGSDPGGVHVSGATRRG